MKLVFSVMRLMAWLVGYITTGNILVVVGRRVAVCKYGENAGQAPAHLYSTGTTNPLALEKSVVVSGTPPSYNNYCDLDRLLQTMTHIVAVYQAHGLSIPHVALAAKHGNACGADIRIGGSKKYCLSGMMAGDPLAIFGGLMMTNFFLEAGCVEELVRNKFDGIIAPGFAPEVISQMRRKDDKCRFIQNKVLGHLSKENLDRAQRLRYVCGGFLTQPNYTFVLRLDHPAIKHYGPKPSEQQKINLFLAWAVGSTSNSNTITLVNGQTLVGNGVGQQDRVGAAELAIWKATRSKHNIEGAVAYSDSFFPYPDGPQTLINKGVKAILTSSGSVKDQETIDVCVANGVSLVMIPDHLGRGFFGH